VTLICSSSAVGEARGPQRGARSGAARAGDPERAAVADGSGPQFDTGELVTRLNDAVLLAPAVLLDARTGWEPAGDDGFRVSVTDAGRTVSAQAFLDDEGRPRDFRTEDPWADLPGGPVQAPWSTPVQGGRSSTVAPG
jgi:hypothetical protein